MFQFTSFGIALLVGLFIVLTQFISTYIDYENSFAIYIGFSSFYFFGDWFFNKAIKIAIYGATYYEITILALLIFITFLTLNNISANYLGMASIKIKILYISFAIIGISIHIKEFVSIILEKRRLRNMTIAQQTQQPLV